jgi:hypothetical protein
LTRDKDKMGRLSKTTGISTTGTRSFPRGKGRGRGPGVTRSRKVSSGLARSRPGAHDSRGISLCPPPRCPARHRATEPDIRKCQEAMAQHGESIDLPPTQASGSCCSAPVAVRPSWKAPNLDQHGGRRVWKSHLMVKARARFPQSNIP